MTARWTAWVLALGPLVALADPGDEDAVRELIESSSMSRYARAIAEVADTSALAVSETLPADLREELRATGEGIVASRIEDDIAAELARELSTAVIQENLLWWSSPAWPAVPRGESIFETLGLERMREIQRSPGAQAPYPDSPSRGTLIAAVVAESRYAEFLADFALAIEAALGRSSSEEAREEETTERRELIARAYEDAAPTIYGHARDDELAAYVEYLRRDAAKTYLHAVRQALIREVETTLSELASRQESALDGYARRRYGGGHEEALTRVTADVDAREMSEQTYFTLDLLRRAHPEDPEILVQLARVELNLGSYATSYEPGMPSGVYPAALARAEQWLEQALALDANHVGTLVLCGHLAYLKREPDVAISMLKRAEARGQPHPWLETRFGNALWQASVLENRPELADEAVRYYEVAFETSSNPTARRVAAQSIADISVERGDLDTADKYYRAATNVPGDPCDDCVAHKYSIFLLYSRRDYEAALRHARIAARPPTFPRARDVLLQALVLRGSELTLTGRRGEAIPLFDEARAMTPALEELAPTFAALPATYLGVRGMRAVGLLPDLSGPTGGRVLVEASRYLDRERLEELLSWGADPRFVEATGETALHMAVLADNVEAVDLLLERGADPVARYTDGRTPFEMASMGDYPHRAEIRALLEQTGAVREEELRSTSGIPLTVGAAYIVKQFISGDRWGHELRAGERVTFEGSCTYRDRTLACLKMKREGEATAFDVAVGKVELVSWTDWFELARAP